MFVVGSHVMKEKVYLLQPVKEFPRWERMLSVLGVTVVDFKLFAKGVFSLQDIEKGLLFADKSQLLYERSISTLCIDHLINNHGTIVVTGPVVPGNFNFRVKELHDTIDPTLVNCQLSDFLNDYSRKFPRLDINLPGLMSIDDKDYKICKINNISRSGARIVSSRPFPQVGSHSKIYIALFGLKKELKLDAKIVRHITPNINNKYQDEFTVKFVDESNSVISNVSNYVDIQYKEKIL